MPREHSLSLMNVGIEPIQFNPVQFNPVQFTPQVAEMSFLQHAMDKREQRRKDATEKASALENAFTQARTQLHNDPETMEWYRQYTQNMSDRMENLKMFGDYNMLQEAATSMAGKFMEDAQYTARAKRNQEYTEWEKAVDASNTETGVKEMYKDKYKYKDSDLFDAEGNIVEGRKWEAPLPKGTLNWSAMYRQCAADVAETVAGSQRGGGTTRDFTATSWSSGYELHEKDLKRILQNVQTHFINNPADYDKFKDGYDYVEWRYNQLVEARKNATPGTSDYTDADDKIKAFCRANGVSEDKFPTEEEYIIAMLGNEKGEIKNAYVKNFAYKRRSDNSQKNTTIRNPDYDAGYQQAQATKQQREKELHPDAEKGADVEQNQDDASNVGHGVGVFFDGAQTSSATQTGYGVIKREYQGN